MKEKHWEEGDKERKETSIDLLCRYGVGTQTQVLTHANTRAQWGATLPDPSFLSHLMWPFFSCISNPTFRTQTGSSPAKKSLFWPLHPVHSESPSQLYPSTWELIWYMALLFTFLKHLSKAGLRSKMSGFSCIQSLALHLTVTITVSSFGHTFSSQVVWQRGIKIKSHRCTDTHIHTHPISIAVLCWFGVFPVGSELTERSKGDCVH